MYYPYGIWKLESNAVLPIVYDEALSYGQQIAHLLHRVNTLQKDIIAIGNILSQENWTEKLDEIVTQLNNVIAEQEEITEDINNINTTILTLQTDVADTQMTINELNLNVIKYINEMTLKNNQIINDLIESVRQQVLEQLCTRNGDTMLVRNPITGTIVSLNNTLASILIVMASFGGLTMAEYRALHWTMEEYRKRKLTMREYAYVLRLLLIQEKLKDNEKKFQKLDAEIEKQNQTILNNTTGYNPLTNSQSTAFQLASQVALQTSLAPTVGEYRSYNYTMGEYRNLKLTMEEYRNLSVIYNFYDAYNNYNKYNNLKLIAIAKNSENYTIYCKLIIKEEDIMAGNTAMTSIGISATLPTPWYIDLHQLNNRYEIIPASGETGITIYDYGTPGEIDLTITFYK